MKPIILLIALMTTLSTTAQSGKASTSKSTFSRSTTITETIHADVAIVWALLTNAADYSRWNSTIISIEGDIKDGEKIKLKSTLDSSRTFKLKVKELVPNKKLVWGDAMGERIYTLEQKGTTTLFSMTEKIGGLMFPLFASKIPSFDAAFEDFAADLKKEAEEEAQE